MGNRETNGNVKQQTGGHAPMCLVCGKPLVQPETGRPRRFCSSACRQKDYRERQKWEEAGAEGPKLWRKGWLFSGCYDRGAHGQERQG